LTKRTPRAELLRQLILDMLQLDGALRRRAEGMTAEQGQTPARWKVLTAAGCDVRTVPQIARRMGLTRQAVQRIANQLVEDGLAEFVDNPDHRASPILRLTDRGVAIDDAISDAHACWSNRIARRLDTRRMETALEAIRDLLRVVESDRE
jgi:DNA-binding MarR family transcriptional regulator